MKRSVTIIEHGRDGSVRYSDGLRSIEGYWEFGGNDVVTIVSMGTHDEWLRDHAWAVPQRDDILRLVADEVIRQRAPTCVAEIDDLRGYILLRVSADKDRAARASARPSAAPDAATYVRRYGDLKSMLAFGVLVIVLVLGAIAWLGRSALSVAPASGVPLGESVRTATHVVTLIQATDPHLPRVTGRGGDDTTSISVLLVPLDGGSPQHVQVVGGLTPNAYSLARVIGSDGRTVWLDVAGLFGVRVSDATLVSVDELRAANPGLDPGWWHDQRGMDIVDGRLHVINSDRSAALDVDPETLEAAPATPRPSNDRFHRQAPDDFMAAGFITPAGKWLGLHAPSELEALFGPRKWVRPVERAGGSNHLRHLCSGEVELSSDGANARVRNIAAVDDSTYLDAVFLRLTPESTPLSSASPDGALMVHTNTEGTGRTLVVSRVDMDGRVQWQADTGLDRFHLQQVMPGETTTAFVGVVPAVPDKLPEPRVVLVDNATGKLAAHSLWR